ncbi:MAG: ARMT1-like domain-containing protein, partial [Candidatus Omnitrophota bacterium]
KIKQKSNSFALRLYGKSKNKVGHSKDRLLASLELAIAGNIIDFGVKNSLNIDVELKKILTREKSYVHKKAVFHYFEFKQVLRKAKTILYLADNAGETVFDRLLMEEIKGLYPEKYIYYAVKENPIINDALRKDAQRCGIGKVAQIISNGSDAPGTVLFLCSKEFLKIYNNADMIISKGQGNFESISQEKRLIFFLFMVKCPVVAKTARCKLGDIILLCNKKGSREFKNAGKDSF